MKHEVGPTVSVLVPARNGADFLEAALQSLARQTFCDFEILAIDNGSTDETPKILRAWAEREPRLRTFRIAEAHLAEVLNRGVALARATLLARLDADDVAFPGRLEAQVRTMQERPSLGLLGSHAALIDASGNHLGEVRLPLSHDEIVDYQRTSSALVASSTIMRTDVFWRAGGYRKGLNVSEDFDLWTRVSELCEVANLPVVHVGYRVHPGSATGRSHVRMALASLCIAAAAEARGSGLPEPFTAGIPTLRLALPLLGLSRDRARRMVRARSIANALVRALVNGRAPAAAKKLAIAIVGSLPVKGVYRLWLTRAHRRPVRAHVHRQVPGTAAHRNAPSTPGTGKRATARRNTFQPLVSVIMPVRNREHSIDRAIKSVLAQTYANFELIVVDDGSTDRTADVAAAYGDQLTLIRRQAAGAYPARNAGFAEARGELVAFADSDDAWFPRKLELQVSLMRSPEVGLVFGDTIHVAEAKNGAERTGLRGFCGSPPKRGWAARALAWRNFIPTTTVLVRRSCLEEIGGFRTRSAISADHLAWFQIALRHKVDFVAEPVCFYTFNADSVSFDVGRSIAARIALFSCELQQAERPPEQKLLRRLLFNLCLHLALAALRGKAQSVDGAWRLARKTAWNAAGIRTPSWGAAFVAHQLWLRARRLCNRLRRV